MPLRVKKQPGESDDRLIARFRRTVINSGIIPELRRREHYTKKSQERKLREYTKQHRIKLAKEKN